MQQVIEPKEARTEQKIRLVDGEFTASEAQDVILALLDQKINFHKLQRLSLCEGNTEANTHYENCRIEELQEEKVIAREFIRSVRNSGHTLKIIGNLEITLVS